MRKLLILIASFSLLLGGTLHANELPCIYKGVRPMGMGGAFVGLSDDANAGTILGNTTLQAKLGFSMGTHRLLGPDGQELTGAIPANVQNVQIANRGSDKG